MSSVERDRLKVLSQVESGQLTREDASRLLGMSGRQLRRLERRYEAEGDVGVIHRLRGRASNRRIPDAERLLTVQLLRERYPGFGPTLASEKLGEEHGIKLSRETVRQIQIQADLWRPRRRRVRARRRRERRLCFGELVQMDTSEHNWFEGRGESCVLIAMIDDATSRVLLRFFPSDTTESNMAMLREWFERYGRPLAIYADKASHFVVNRPTGVDEELSGTEAETQIGRALRELDIEYIAAHSPQAKGRVERLFGTCQDRLVKELRLRGVGTMAEANEFLDKVFLPMWQRRFTQPAVAPGDAHRSRKGFDLAAILSHQETRTVQNDYTVQYKNQHYQIARRSIGGGLRNSKVTVEERLDGTVRLRWRGKYLRHEGVKSGGRASRGERRSSWARAGRKRQKREPTGWKPAPDHPWRQYKNRETRSVPGRPPPGAS